MNRVGELLNGRRKRWKVGEVKWTFKFTNVIETIFALSVITKSVGTQENLLLIARCRSAIEKENCLKIANRANF